MNRILLILTIFCFPIAISAQEEVPRSLDLGMVEDSLVNINLEESPTIIMPEEFADFSYDDDINNVDTLNLPNFNELGHTRIGLYPSSWGGWYDWGLHEGLNLSVGLSAFGSFGHSPFKGMGFGQNIGVMYALPIGDKLSFAVGGYLGNLFYSGDSYHEAGINAVIGYRFDEHWEGYIYGQKSLIGNKIPMPLYDVSDIGDRIGAAIKYNFTPSFSIQVSVEANKKP